MSTRHRARQTGPSSALQEERDQRKAEHRKVRRTVNQSLHLATLETDHDGLASTGPHPTHGYTDEHEPPVPHAMSDPSKRLKHGKQSFWKRRTLERRRKALAYEKHAPPGLTPRRCRVLAEDPASSHPPRSRGPNTVVGQWWTPAPRTHATRRLGSRRSRVAGGSGPVGQRDRHRDRRGGRSRSTRCRHHGDGARHRALHRGCHLPAQRRDGVAARALGAQGPRRHGADRTRARAAGGCRHHGARSGRGVRGVRRAPAGRTVAVDRARRRHRADRRRWRPADHVRLGSQSLDALAVAIVDATSWWMRRVRTALEISFVVVGGLAGGGARGGHAAAGGRGRSGRRLGARTSGTAARAAPDATTIHRNEARLGAPSGARATPRTVPVTSDCDGATNRAIPLPLVSRQDRTCDEQSLVPFVDRIVEHRYDAAVDGVYGVARAVPRRLPRGPRGTD